MSLLFSGIIVTILMVAKIMNALDSDRIAIRWTQYVSAAPKLHPAGMETTLLHWIL